MSSFVYGPVPSRRLGRSLGVDIVPFKTCTFDCIYCQLGRTTHKTVCHSPLAPVEDVVRDVQDALKRLPRPDYVTISGSGEPTLHSELGEIISRIKSFTDVPVAIITNGSLLFQEEVRTACGMADLVVPSLDAGDEAMFRYVNRPHESLSFANILEGLVQFRKEYRGKIWLEVFLLGGVTAVASEVMKIKEHADRIQPDRIQLNTVVRPAAEEFAFPVPPGEMAKLCKLLGENAEAIAPFAPKAGGEESQAVREDILALVARRPCSVEDIANGLMMNRAHVLKYLDNLVSERLVGYTLRDGRVYYKKERGMEDRFDEFARDLQETVIRDARSYYSQKVVDLWLNPQNMGPLEQPDGYAKIKGPCGDTMEIFLEVVGGRVVKATFVTDGCGPTVAAGSMATQLAIGKTLDDARAIPQEMILNALGGLPDESRHCALLAAETLAGAIDRVAWGGYASLCGLRPTLSEKDMRKKRLRNGKGLLVFAALFVSISALLCLLVLGPAHNHRDLKTHRDCPACHYEASFSLLLHEGVALILAVPVGFLATLWGPLPVSARLISQLPIRAPPLLLN